MKATDTWDPDPYGAPRVKRSKGGKHKARRTRELQRLLATAIVKFAGHPHSCSRHDTSTWACDCGFVEWLRQAMREQQKTWTAWTALSPVIFVGTAAGAGVAYDYAHHGLSFGLGAVAVVVAIRAVALYIERAP